MKLSWVPYILLAVALLITGMITRYVSETTEQQERLEFEKTAESIVRQIDNRMAACETLLRAARGLFTASEVISAAEFALFSSELRLTDHFQGVLGIGFSKRILPEEKDLLVEQRRGEGWPSFHVWPRVENGEEHAIYYLEPPTPANTAALGYNMFADPIRRAAMALARDTGSAVLSGRVTLVQEMQERREPGFLLYFPVYRKGAHPSSLAERRSALDGFVYSPFRAGDLLRTAASDLQVRDVSYAVFDGGGTRPDELLYASDGFEDSTVDGGRFKSLSYIAIARRTWTVVTLSTAAIDGRSERYLVPLTAYAGALVTLLIFGTTLSLVRARHIAERNTEELEQAREEAEDANRLKDEFLATVSHELRTPLNAISGWTQLLLEDDSLDAETRKGLSVIDRNAHAQAALVDELLDVSRIVSGRLLLRIEKADLIGIVKEALETVRPAADARQVEIRCSYFADSVPMMADPNRLRQVVWNILSNSINFSPTGAPVDVNLRPCPLGVELRVSDRGKGIAPDFLPYVFNPFRQQESGSARQHGGLGLGLAIVRRLVELHGGTVKAESAGEGKGATFTVQLPIRTVAESAPSPEASLAGPEANSQPAHSLHGAHVLVVDDEEDSRSLIARVLEQKGATVRTADSAPAALQILGSERVDVLLSDIGMPGTDGCALLEEVRARFPGRNLPAIAVTAYATASDRERTARAGFAQHLSKPVDPAVLQRTVARWWTRRE